MGPLLAGCASLAARSDTRFTVEMTDLNRFSPGTIEAPAGSTIVWRNSGRFAHTTTADPSLAESSANVLLPAGAEPWDSGPVDTGVTWERTFDAPGTYLYFCRFHETDGMIASITITE